MRILGFSKRWQKLSNQEFTTFRFPRKDRDWQAGEVVQIVYKPRSKEREILGIAEIINQEPKFLADLTHEEATRDGFINLYDMFRWIERAHRGKDMFSPMNKLTLRKIGNW